MARVFVLNETSCDDLPDRSQCTLWFQWCRYVYDDGHEPELGYRFIWRRAEGDGGGLQAARGQARIPSVDMIEHMIAKARKEGWGHFDGDDHPNAYAILVVSLDNVLDPKLPPELREKQVRAFVQVIANGETSLYDLDTVIRHVPIGGAIGRGEVFKNPGELYASLNSIQQNRLREHIANRVRHIREEFPDLAREFERQFRREWM